jgi:hypothetical protein
MKEMDAKIAGKKIDKTAPLPKMTSQPMLQKPGVRSPILGGMPMKPLARPTVSGAPAPIDKRSSFNNPALTDPVRNNSVGTPSSSKPPPMQPKLDAMPATSPSPVGAPTSGMPTMQPKMKKGGKINLADCKVNTAKKNPSNSRW